MKNIVIAILVAVILVLGFLFLTQKKSGVNYEPWPETEPATVKPATNTNNNSPVSNNSTQTNTNGSSGNSSPTPTNSSDTITSSENIETPLFIKII